jgi:hypothetical protein
LTKRSRSPRKSAAEASTKVFNTERKPGAVISTFRILSALEAEEGEVWREGVRGVMRFKICSVKNDAIYKRNMCLMISVTQSLEKGSMSSSSDGRFDCKGKAFVKVGGVKF